MKQSFRFLALTLLLVTCSISWSAMNEVAFANSEIKGKISDVQREREQKQAESQQKAADLQKLEQDMQHVNEEIKKIDDEVATTSLKIRDKRIEIEGVRADIEILEAEIIVLEERIAERDILLKERARSMYQSGGSVDYLEVILGSKNFGDFLDRVGALSVIAQQDRNIIEAHIEDQVELEEKKEAVELELKSLEGHLNDLETLKAELEVQRSQKDDLMLRLEQKEGNLNNDLTQIEHADDILRSQEAALKNELAAYEERQRREQAAQAAQAAKTAKTAQAASQPSSRNGGSSQVHNAPAVTNSGFMRPATGSMTSTFGPRSSFGGRMHNGIDIGKNGRSGDVPIVSVQSGTVVSARYMNGYGNTVIVAHYVEGRLITTLYAHLEYSTVSSGQSVSKGQTLGMMGNTGASFGAHLHFEVHEGGWNGSKSNAVNPLGYIPH